MQDFYHQQYGSSICSHPAHGPPTLLRGFGGSRLGWRTGLPNALGDLCGECQAWGSSPRASVPGEPTAGVPKSPLLAWEGCCCWRRAVFCWHSVRRNWSVMHKRSWIDCEARCAWRWGLRQPSLRWLRIFWFQRLLPHGLRYPERERKRERNWAEPYLLGPKPALLLDLFFSLKTIWAMMYMTGNHHIYTHIIPPRRHS